MRTLAIIFAVGLGVLGWTALAAHESLAEPEPVVLTPAQTRLEKAAHDVCAEQYGPHAAHRWIDGLLNCFGEVR